jgi:signal peptidase I
MSRKIWYNSQMLHEQSSSAEDIISFIWETTKIVLISLAIVLPIRYFLVQPFFVKGESMVPNFQNQDYILVDKLSYRFNEPKRGDVVVFKYPLDPKEYFIKRIIGLPGETVEVKNNHVTIYNSQYPSGLTLDEAIYLPRENETEGNLRVKVDPNEYFVMGDNRMHSSDSRRWGQVNKTFLSGIALVRLWPLGAIDKIPRVSYPAPVSL